MICVRDVGLRLVCDKTRHKTYRVLQYFPEVTDKICLSGAVFLRLSVHPSLPVPSHFPGAQMLTLMTTWQSI